VQKQASTQDRACVLTPGAAFYGNGRAVPLREGVHSDVRALLAGVEGRFTPQATLVLNDASTAILAGCEAELKADGWSWSAPGPWTFFRRGGQTVALGCRRSWRPKVHTGTLYGDDVEPGALAMLLDRYHQLTGYAWCGTGATTGLNALRLTWENSRWEPRWSGSVVAPVAGAGVLNWQRELNEDEATWGYVHTFDANAAYLGSAISADLAWDQLTPTGPQPFDERLPGFWLIDLATSTLEICADPTRPPLLSRIKRGQAWVTTPYAKLLRELGDPLDVADSWTGQPVTVDGRQVHGPTSRVFRTWGEALREARKAAGELPGGRLRQQLGNAVKHTYKDVIGGLARTDRDGKHLRVYRPDWAAHIIDLWRATLYRRMVEIKRTQGVWPVRVWTDAISYADCVATPTYLAEAIGVSACAVECGCVRNTLAARGRLGSYKHDACATTRQWIADHPARRTTKRRELVAA
jgi:hypothetical protein